MTEDLPPPPSYKAKEPMYAADEFNDIGVVRVAVTIPGMKVKNKWTTRNYIPVRDKEPDNVDIKIDFEERAFTLTVDGKGKLAGKHWALRIRKLHHPVIKDNCTHKVKDEKVVLHLKKVTPQSWYPDLREGLDAYEEPEEEEQKEPKGKPKRKKKKKTSGEEVKGKGEDDDGEEGEGEEGEEDEEEDESDEDEDESDEDEDDEKN